MIPQHDLTSAVRQLAARAPRLAMIVLKALVRRAWRWYSQLSLPAMLVATSALGATVWIGLAEVPAARTAVSEARAALSSALVVSILLVLLVGAVRGGRR